MVKITHKSPRMHEEQCNAAQKCKEINFTGPMVKTPANINDLLNPRMTHVHGQNRKTKMKQILRYGQSANSRASN